MTHDAYAVSDFRHGGGSSCFLSVGFAVAQRRYLAIPGQKHTPCYSIVQAKTFVPLHKIIRDQLEETLQEIALLCSAHFLVIYGRFLQVLSKLYKDYTASTAEYFSSLPQLRITTTCIQIMCGNFFPAYASYTCILHEKAVIAGLFVNMFDVMR